MTYSPHHPSRFITPEKEALKKKLIFQYYKKENISINKIAEMFLTTPKKVKEIINEVKMSEDLTSKK